MGLYSRYVLPRVIDLVCGVPMVSSLRAGVVPAATGTVLEIGIGSGHNLPYYDESRVTKVIGLEPDPVIRAIAARRAAACPVPVEFIGLEAEEIPLDAASVDSVVVTFTLCTIPGVAVALRGMRRVLKPGGRMYFVEHGEAPDAGVRRWQGLLQPMWGMCAGGCHLGRPIPDLIRQGGFTIDRMEESYVARPHFASYVYRGSARG